VEYIVAVFLHAVGDNDLAGAEQVVWEEINEDSE
jgi:hypothetical protein